MVELGEVLVVVWLVVVEVVVCGCCGFMLAAELWLSGEVEFGWAALWFSAMADEEGLLALAV